LKILVLAGLFGWLYSSHMARLFSFWLRPDWSHGFLIPLFSLYLIHNKRDELLLGEHRGSVWGAVVMILSVLAYTGSIMMKIGYPQPLTMVGVIAGIVLLVRGWRTLWIALFPMGFLILAMPPPERLYRAVTQPLQKAAAALAC
jgi:exosortase